MQPRSGRGGDPVDGFGVDGIDGEERCGCECGERALREEPKDGEGREDAGDREQEVCEVEGSWGESEACANDAIGEHLERAIGLILNCGVLMGEAYVRGEDPGEGCGWSDCRVHHDLFVVVPDEAVGDAVVIDEKDSAARAQAASARWSRAEGRGFAGGPFFFLLASGMGLHGTKVIGFRMQDEVQTLTWSVPFSHTEILPLAGDMTGTCDQASRPACCSLGTTVCASACSWRP